MGYESKGYHWYLNSHVSNKIRNSIFFTFNLTISWQYVSLIVGICENTLLINQHNDTYCFFLLNEAADLHDMLVILLPVSADWDQMAGWLHHLLSNIRLRETSHQFLLPGVLGHSAEDDVLDRFRRSMRVVKSVEATADDLLCHRRSLWRVVGGGKCYYLLLILAHIFYN